MNKIFSKILITIIIIAGIIGAAIGLNHLENYEEFFYVQVDNSKISGARPTLSNSLTISKSPQPHGATIL